MGTKNQITEQDKHQIIRDCNTIQRCKVKDLAREMELVTEVGYALARYGEPSGGMVFWLLNTELVSGGILWSGSKWVVVRIEHYSNYCWVSSRGVDYQRLNTYEGDALRTVLTFLQAPYIMKITGQIGIVANPDPSKPANASLVYVNEWENRSREDRKVLLDQPRFEVDGTINSYMTNQGLAQTVADQLNAQRP